jgi:hypothetical protein
MTGKSVGMRRQPPLRRPKGCQKPSGPSVRQPETGTTYAGSASYLVDFG